uniref:Uncharacterized protein n=1 Tax=Timema shepardi TaxID=629360 RepID=A0A7R9FZ98_TIMSH|nr:unnamed protein product [Timema shepardi]
MVSVGRYGSIVISRHSRAIIGRELACNVHDCFEDPPYECSRDCQLYSPSVSLRRATAQPQDSGAPLVYVYESGSRKRKMALPKGDCFRPRDMPESYSLKHFSTFASEIVVTEFRDRLRAWSSSESSIGCCPYIHELRSSKSGFLPAPTDRTALYLRARTFARQI